MAQEIKLWFEVAPGDAAQIPYIVALAPGSNLKYGQRTILGSVTGAQAFTIGGKDGVVMSVNMENNVLMIHKNLIITPVV